jgi:hypothetical protein
MWSSDHVLALEKSEVIELRKAKLYDLAFEEDPVTLRATPASLASDAFRVLARSAQALLFLGKNLK